MVHDANEPIDVVYTWVDDSFPDYMEELRKHATDPRDLNPNRTRDNLDTLKFSLRSLVRNAPFIRNIIILSHRPQVPRWLDTSHPRIRVVHHDEFMDAHSLPSFSSFSIVSYIHRVPGISKRFIYVTDDCLVFSRLRMEHFHARDGRPQLFFNPRKTLRHEELNVARTSMWNLGLATAEAALDREHGRQRRRHIIHGPMLLDRDLFADVMDRFPAEIETTRRARFRANGTVPPRYMYAHSLVATGEGVVATDTPMEGYMSVENFFPWTWAQLRYQEWRRPLSITLNDSFNARPNPRVERLVRETLERWFPDPSPFERKPG